jgi:diguanylate cyclase (GGDEF)-like protein
MNEYLIVCIDDDEHFLRSLAETLPARVAALCPKFQCSFEFVASGAELFELLGAGASLPPLAMVISDQIMPGLDGIELVEKVKSLHPDVVSMLLTGNGGLESARYAINHHLLDQYVSKPVEDMQEFASTTANLLKRYHLDLEERQRTAQLAETVEQLRRSNLKIHSFQMAAESVAKLSKGIKRLDFDEVVELIAQDVPKIFQAQRGVFCLVSESGHVNLVRRANCPCPESDLEKRGDVQDAFSSGLTRLEDIPAVCRQLCSRPPEVLVPLRFADVVGEGGEATGGGRGYFCLCTSSDDPGNSQEVLQYKAELLGEILSVSLTNAALYEKAKRDSHLDSLTGASTRRVLEERLQAEHARTLRYGQPCCLVILDVDHFKRVNDADGHLAGDQTLRALAGILASETRGTDLLARYGGDEFVILMPETTLAEAGIAAERIRRRVESELKAGGRALTVSCGVATWSGAPGETATEAFRRADAALYRAKAAGRNRVNVEPAALPAPIG